MRGQEGAAPPRWPWVLARLELRRVLLGSTGALCALWLALLVLGTRAARQGAEVRLARAEVLQGLRRQSLWSGMLGLACALLLLRAGRAAQRLRGGECDWIAPRPTTRGGVLSAGLTGLCLAATLLGAAGALAIEAALGAGAPSYQRIGGQSLRAPLEIPARSRLRLAPGLGCEPQAGDQLRALVLASSVEAALLAGRGAPGAEEAPRAPGEGGRQGTERAPVASDEPGASDQPGQGPAAARRQEPIDYGAGASDARLLARSGGLEFRGPRARVSTRTRLSVELGELEPGAPLELEVENLGETPILLLAAQGLEAWRPTPSSSRASWQAFAHYLFAIWAGCALALGLGFWMGPLTAAALVLCLALALGQVEGAWAWMPSAAWPRMLATIGQGRVPAPPRPRVAALSLLAVAAGLGLARAGLRSWRHPR